MCLYVNGNQNQKFRHHAYKIVKNYYGSRLGSLYQNYQYLPVGKWQFNAEGYVSFSASCGDNKVVIGYHLCSNLKSAKKMINNLPGQPVAGDYEIWLCEVRPKDFVASGYFYLYNNTGRLRDTKAKSVVYNSFRFVKKVK